MLYTVPVPKSTRILIKSPCLVEKEKKKLRENWQTMLAFHLCNRVLVLVTAGRLNLPTLSHFRLRSGKCGNVGKEVIFLVSNARGPVVCVPEG